MQFLFNTQQPKYLYVLKSFILALCMVLPASYIVSNFVSPSESPDIKINVIGFLGVVIISPLGETLLMTLSFFVIKLFTNKFSVICFVSAFFWASLHSLLIPAWGLVTFFTFLVFSIAFQVWDKVSRKDAYIIVFSIHALVNFFAFTLSV
ncbi:hypothetical protein CMT41_08020 [Colwellia sp. MT41]|uniref:CPBP family intramembrane metalloprotease n=1 Tax=Colwellia marinimaniae TaxID=1513592 RepID=A0ABQ0N093_9GAMM|nr:MULTISPECIES: hypothetical protein [Colwellia]ALO34671.1 hypothetical protein CMT41_08020 [Colwellia sp. MT41]GAW97979.1 hypothetical protein MTCD1_03635 [Colwellia marinimaniae]